MGVGTTAPGSARVSPFFERSSSTLAITVLDEFIHGDRYAERHIVELVKRDSERVRQEVYLFAERDADGRFVRIEETTLVLYRDQPDQDLVGAE